MELGRNSISQVFENVIAHRVIKIKSINSFLISFNSDRYINGYRVKELAIALAEYYKIKCAITYTNRNEEVWIKMMSLDYYLVFISFRSKNRFSTLSKIDRKFNILTFYDL